MNYKRIYSSLIEKAKSEKREYRKGTYYERHHIKPRCLGGEGKSGDWKTHPNLVLLTAKEHYLAHAILLEMYPDNKKLQIAYGRMCFHGEDHRRDFRISSRAYERAKHLNSISRKGIPKSKEAIEKRTATRRLRGNYIRPREAVEKMMETKHKNGTLGIGIPYMLVETGEIFLSRKKIRDFLKISDTKLIRYIRDRIVVRV